MNLFQLTLCLGLIVLFNGLLGVESQRPGRNKVHPHNRTVLSLNYQDSDTVCILMTLTKTDISITSKSTQKTIYSQQVNRSIDWTIVPDHSKSFCEPSYNNTQRLTLEKDGNFVGFEFKLINKPNNNTNTKKTSVPYTLSRIIFEAENLTTVGKNETSLLDKERSMRPDLKLKNSIKTGFSFECRHIYTFKWDLNDDEEIKISIQGLKFSAFRISNSTEFDESKKVLCDFKPKAKPGNDIIPIAVGGVLTGILVISLIGYLVIRSRKS